MTVLRLLPRSLILTGHSFITPAQAQAFCSIGKINPVNKGKQSKQDTLFNICGMDLQKKQGKRFHSSVSDFILFGACRHLFGACFVQSNANVSARVRQKGCLAHFPNKSRGTNQSKPHIRGGVFLWFPFVTAKEGVSSKKTQDYLSRSQVA